MDSNGQLRKYTPKKIDKSDLHSLCEITKRAKYLQARVIQIQQDNPNCDENRNEADLQVGDEYFKRFIFTNIKNFCTVKIFTKEFAIFNEATKGQVFPNIEYVEIIENCDPKIPAQFLNSMTQMQKIRLKPRTMKTYEQSIMKIDSLKCLEFACRDDDMVNMDCVVDKVITKKAHLILHIDVKCVKFPPQWFSNNALESCRYLKKIALDTRKCWPNHICTKNHFEINAPFMYNLKELYIIGDYFCTKYLILITIRCPVLKRVVLTNHDTYQFIKETLSAIKHNRWKIYYRPLEVEQPSHICFI